MQWLRVHFWILFVLCRGTFSKESINGCEQQSCQNGGTCESHGEDFRCLCSKQSKNGRLYGGKSCEIALTGCDYIQCENGGICSPLFVGGEHTFTCFCLAGFTGSKCQIQTAFSFESQGYIQLPDLQAPVNVTFTFKTDREVGTLLQQRADNLLLSIELVDGHLCLYSSQHGGPSTLVQMLPDYSSDNKWHTVEASLGGRVSLMWLLCTGSNCSRETRAEIIELEHTSSFTPTQPHSLTLGAASHIWGSDNPAVFLGCFRDVFVNSQIVLPASTTDYIQRNVTLGCSNKDKCIESPCQNRGRCVSHGWRNYTCECHRPYEGHHCEKEYVTARFGNKDQQSYAVFSLDDDPGNTLIVSMFVRTRQSSGLLLILANSTSQYLRMWLENGIVNVQINNFETLVGHSVINDGHFHLLTVTLEGTTASLLQSAQNQYFADIRHIKANPGDSVYVGGHIDSRASASFGGYFKGCVQDLRINNKRLQFYPIAALVESHNLQQLNNVEEGCSSDNACVVNPCLNGGVCYSMWDDFICNCPPNTAGRRCEKVKWCEMSPCPSSAVCQLSSQGFDCLSNVTIRAEGSPLHYRSNGNIKHSLNRLSISFRTRQAAATLMYAQKGLDFLIISLMDSQLTLQLQVGLDQNASVVHSVGPVSDGLWHTVELKIENSTMQTALWILVLDGNKMLIEGSRLHPQVLDFLREETDIFLGGMKEFGSMKLSGCLGPAEIGGLVLPFHKDSELNFPRPQPEQFVRVDRNTVALQNGCWGTRVCDPNPCQNDGVCEDVFDLYQCTCSSEWTGLLCQESTDRCLSSPCVFGNCSSMSGEYKCDCEPGYGGHQCESEVNVCENNHCSNGATCLQGLKSYTCLCPQNVTGQYCNEKLPEIPWYFETQPLPQLPVAACIGTRNYKCFNGGNCSKDNACHCLPGFIGEWCEKDVDECASEPCMNGGICVNYINSYECMCDINYTGAHCQIDVSDFYVYVFLGMWQNLFQLMSYLALRFDDGPEVEWDIPLE